MKYRTTVFLLFVASGFFAREIMFTKVYRGFLCILEEVKFVLDIDVGNCILVNIQNKCIFRIMCFLLQPLVIIKSAWLY